MKSLYIRLAKTGSTSISSMLNKNTLEVTPTLKGERRYRRKEKRLNFAFTFVRNPYDRIVSSFLMITRSSHSKRMILALRDEFNVNTTFEDFLALLGHYRRNYYEYSLGRRREVFAIPWYEESKRWFRRSMKPEENRVSYELFWILSHTEPMVESIEFFCPITAIDFIGRYEALSDDYERLSAILEIEGTLPHLNQAVLRKHYSEYYNRATINLVTEMYQRDLETFGYSFSGTEGRPIVQYDHAAGI